MGSGSIILGDTPNSFSSRLTITMVLVSVGVGFVILVGSAFVGSGSVIFVGSSLVNSSSVISVGFRVLLEEGFCVGSVVSDDFNK